MVYCLYPFYVHFFLMKSIIYMHYKGSTNSLYTFPVIDS